MRFTKDQRRQLEESAAENGLSLQAEIIRRLAQTFTSDDQVRNDIEELKARQDRIEADMAKAEAEQERLFEKWQAMNANDASNDDVRPGKVAAKK